MKANQPRGHQSPFGPVLSEPREREKSRRKMSIYIEQAAKTTGADLAIQAHLFQACEHKIALHVDAAISVVDTDPVEADSWAYEAGREAWDFDLKAPGKLAPYPVLSAAFKRGFDSVDQSRSQREMSDQPQSQPINPLFGALIADAARNRVKRRLKAAFQRTPKPARVRPPRESLGD